MKLYEIVENKIVNTVAGVGDVVFLLLLLIYNISLYISTYQSRIRLITMINSTGYQI